MKRLGMLLAFLLLSLLPLQAIAGIPYVTGTSPSNGDGNVAVDAPVVINFNENVLWGEVYNSGVYRITISEEVTGIPFLSLTYLPAQIDKTFTLSHATAFKTDTYYRVTVSNLIRSEATEEQMAAPYEFVFKTTSIDVNRPSVIATSPAASAINVPLDTVVNVYFSEPMRYTSIDTAEGATTLKLYNLTTSSYVSATAVYVPSTNSATVTPTAPLAKNSEYRVEVAATVQDWDLPAKTMVANYSTTFKTILSDTTAPKIVGTSPTNGSTGVSTSTISITFSEPMDQTTLTGSNIVVKQGTTVVAGTIGYDPGSATASFLPSSGFEFAKDYTVSVSTSVKDAAGNSLAAAYSFKFTTVQAVAPADMSAYSHIPPFIAGARVKPNVLLLVDNSGSMDEQAYDEDYNQAKDYYGYFNSNGMYSYTNNRFELLSSVSQDRTKGLTLTASDQVSGNFLNWLATRRIDAVRMVLTGGLKDNANERLYYPGPLFSKNYGGRYYKVTTSSAKAVIKVTVGSNTETYQSSVYVSDTECDTNCKGKLGLIRLFFSEMRFGIMNFNGGYDFEDKGGKDGGFVQIDIGQTGADFINQVLLTPAETWTPLAEALYEATRYFGATTSAYNGGTYSGKQPIEQSCQKNFVLILTDGESTKDKNLPGGYWKKYNGNDPVSDTAFSVKDYLLGNTTKNIQGIRELEPTTSIVYPWISYFPSSPWDTAISSSNEGTWYLPAVAYYAHKKDLRSDFSGLQNLTIYSVFAFDDSEKAKTLLKLASKYGGYEDTDGSGAPDAEAKWAKKDADGNVVPKTYFEASDGAALEKELRKAFEDILARVASGTAASILNNSEGSGANLLQAVFFPKKAFDEGTEVEWTGELQNLWYYLDPYLALSTVRVDTVKDNILDLKQDKIARFEFDNSTQQTVVRLATDTDGDGDADTSWVTYSPDDLTNVKSLWRAGRLLWERNLSTNPRTIYTRTNDLLDSSSTSFDNTATGLAKLSYSLESGYSSKLTASPFFLQMLQTANETEADKLLKYIHGVPEYDANGKLIDIPGYRSRLVTMGTTRGIWRLGDIVSSTPKLLANMALNTYAQPVPTGYADGSYDTFVKSADYQARGMVFAGANDGMLHAFKLGTLEMINDGTSNKAELTGTNLGNEEWAFVPRNMLPYLRYLANPLYSHLFYVDGSTLLVDVAINRPEDNDTYKFADNSLMFPNCSDSQYWNCIKKTTYSDQTTKVLDKAKSSWRTVLIGSTGLGGAGRNVINSGYCYQKTGSNCVKTPVDGTGLSSYYALDVTDPVNPKFMWEFSGDLLNGTDKDGLNSSDDRKGGNLGYATSGPVIVRVGDKDKNGRWLAVFASGPTGPIVNKQFMGRSDQPLRLFVVDIGTGTLVRTINTGIDAAFSGSLSNGAIDTDRSKPYSEGFYSDDAFYIGYTKQTDSTNWHHGGVGRVLTKESLDPSTWTFSKLYEGTDVGPVTSAVTKLQDRGNRNLWLYFGTGRYFFKDTTTIDDSSNQRRIYGIKEPCYDSNANDISQSCTPTVLDTTSLQNQTTIGAFDPSNQGWYVNLDPADSTAMVSAERVITDPIASPSGVVYYTTFQPNADVCSYGGNSYIWAVNYATGGTPPPRSMMGKLMIQVSTGGFVEVTQVTDKGGRRSDSIQGVPPKGQGLTLLTNPKPVKKIMHIQEK